MQFAKRNIRLFYLHELLFAAAEGMFAIGTAVFLYQFFGNVASVFLWNLCWNIPHFLIFTTVVNLALRRGKPIQCMMAGIICKFSAILLLVNAPSDGTTQVYIAALFIGLWVSLYWPLKRWLFAVNVNAKCVGKQVSNLVSIKLAVGCLSPLIAGAIGYFFGVDKTLYSGAVFLFLGAIPLVFFKFDSATLDSASCTRKEIFLHPDLKKVRSAYFSRGITQFSADLTWKMAFIVFIGSIGSLGAITGLSALLGTLLSKLIGKKFDTHDRTQILNLTTTMRISSGLLKSLLFLNSGFLLVLGAQILSSFSVLAHTTVMDSYLYSYSRTVKPIAFLLNREFFISLGRIASSLVLTILFSYCSANLLWTVLALGSLAFIGNLKLASLDHLLIYPTKPAVSSTVASPNPV